MYIKLYVKLDAILKMKRYTGDALANLCNKFPTLDPS